MKKEFIVERQGRAFVMYAGLLNLAHENGLKSIRTELIQAPTDENRQVAICAATVILERNDCEQIYTGIGDAAENNVGPAMRSSLIRMAETRAKARALRDAVNVGVSAFEELSEGDSPENTRRAGRPRATRPERPDSGTRETSSPSVRMMSTSESDIEAITPAQTNAITSLCRPRTLDADALAREKFEAEGLSSLTAGQAGELIRLLTTTSRTRTSAVAV